MEKIENCPFCGGMAVLKRIPDATYFPYYVRCSNVNCEMNVATCSRKTPEEAIKIWNHRPGEADAQPGWIPWDSGRFPEESGTYTVTAYDGATKRVTYAKYQKRLKRWELTGARAYWRVLAWQPKPKPYREGRQDGCI